MQHRVGQQKTQADTDGHQTVKPASAESPQPPAGAATSGTERGQPREALEEFFAEERILFERLLSRLTSHQTTGHWGAVVNSYASAEIPEWEIRQRLDAIAGARAALSGIADPEAAITAAREALRGVVAAKEKELEGFRKCLGRDPLVMPAWLEPARAALALLEGRK